MIRKLLVFLFLISSFLTVKGADEPSYPGGKEALDKFISSQLQYPETAKENGVEGIVLVGFIVMNDGHLRDIKIIKFVDPDLEEEAMRIVGIMPPWIPAEKEGAPVEAPSKVEIPFILED